MKNRIKTLFIIFIVASWQSVDSAAVRVVVPKQYLIEKASLVVYMLDPLGNQCVGTCQLNEGFAKRNILQQDLRMQQSDSLIQLSDSIELTNLSQPRDNEILLHIEFDVEMRVMRVLIVKDSLLADDPFDVVSIPVDNFLEEFDEFSSLIGDFDSTHMKKSVRVKSHSSLNQYMLYAKIYCMMQYKHAKRSMKNLTAWLCRKK